jgi:opacity protein-like surface antigen
MLNGRRVVLLIALIAGLVCGAASASAEWTIDLYGGATWTQSADLGVRGRDSTGNGVDLTIFKLDADTGFTLGARGGYWFDSLPFFGVDLDIFYMQIPLPAQTRTGTGVLTGQILGKTITVNASGIASIPSVTLPLLGFAPELRLRLPLMADAAFPRGRLQPYVSAGPAWGFSLDNNDVSMQLGGKVSAGVAYQLTPWLGLFSEYRYAFFPGFEFTSRNLTYKADFNTHSAALGVSFSF